jgi:polyisoprenoid-binding protein YceI
MKCKFVLLLLLSVSFVFGQGNYRIANYYLVVKGTSNLHDWESKANEVRANGSMTFDAGVLKSIQSLTVEIPVKTIKSTKGSIMDNKTYDALKADQHPNITYKLEKVTSLSKGNDGYSINATGNLTIGGATNKIDMSVYGKVGSEGNITFSGSKKLKMTDYKINPPTALMGTLTTGNEVEIAFTVVLKQI